MFVNTRFAYIWNKIQSLRPNETFGGEIKISDAIVLEISVSCVRNILGWKAEPDDTVMFLQQQSYSEQSPTGFYMIDRKRAVDLS